MPSSFNDLLSAVNSLSETVKSLVESQNAVTDSVNELMKKSELPTIIENVADPLGIELSDNDMLSEFITFEYIMRKLKNPNGNQDSKDRHKHCANKASGVKEDIDDKSVALLNLKNLKLKEINNANQKINKFLSEKISEDAEKIISDLEHEYTTLKGLSSDIRSYTNKVSEEFQFLSEIVGDVKMFDDKLKQDISLAIQQKVESILKEKDSLLNISNDIKDNTHRISAYVSSISRNAPIARTKPIVPDMQGSLKASEEATDLARETLKEVSPKGRASSRLNRR